jgi:MFS family permease
VLAGMALAGRGVMAMAALLFAFFVAFNILEAILPSLVSRIAPARARGTAIGVYNTAQTLGLFVGGLAGGWIAGRHGPGIVFGACAAAVLAWLGVAAGMRTPQRAGSSVAGSAVNPAEG